MEDKFEKHTNGLRDSLEDLKSSLERKLRISQKHVNRRETFGDVTERNNYEHSDANRRAMKADPVVKKLLTLCDELKANYASGAEVDKVWSLYTDIVNRRMDEHTYTSIYEGTNPQVNGIEETLLQYTGE